MDASLQELERQLLQAPGDPERLDLLLEIARCHAAGFRNREGLRAAREGLEIARRRRDPIGVGRALSAATLCHYQRGDFVSAVATGLDAVEAYADGDLAGRSRALQSIALALFSIEAYELAESVAERSVADARAANDREREAYAGNVHGMILADTGRFNAARRAFRISANHYRLSGDIVRLKKCTSNIGHSYRKQGIAQERAGRPMQARHYWNQALRVYRIAHSTGRHDADDAIILGAIAECECRIGEPAAAYTTIARALHLARGARSPQILANALLWESNILRAKGEVEAAEWACERAVAAAEPLEHDRILVTCLNALAEIHSVRGRAEEAAAAGERAERLALARAAIFTQVREQMGPLWERYTAVRPADSRRDAA